MLIAVLLCALLSLKAAQAAVTIYSQIPLGAATGTAAAASYTGAAAYNPATLNPPPIPSPAPPNQFFLQLQANSAQVQNVSIPQSGSFLGFSIEFSIINQIIGINASFIQVPFLNLMSNIVQRGGQVNIRVGGNSQEQATLVSSLADGKMMEKNTSNTQNPTQTPGIQYTAEVFYLLNNVSSLTNVKWYLGIPFYDPSNLQLEIAQYGKQILGSHLIGLQVGNEPDLYVAHGHRNSTYSPYDYVGEFAVVVQAMTNNPAFGTPSNLIGPNIATGAWTPEMVWATPFVSQFSANLGALAVEHYPTDNCAAQYGTAGQIQNPQDIFVNYLNHNASQNLVQPYLNSAGVAQAAGKPLLMFETNTASCGGFPGISDSFGAALWMLDYGLQMAYSNFSGALLHVGGQNVYYNPFTPPPTNQSTFHQWSIGPTYYSVLAVAETFGQSGNAQIVDLYANNNNPLTPVYAIYEKGQLAKLALFNYMTDPSGANSYTMTFAIGGGQTGQPNGTPPQIQVKYLVANSVSEKHNITWAGQTFGGSFASDGRPEGTLDVQTVTCSQSSNTCRIQVPAPGFALAILSPQDGATPATSTFSTSAVTKLRNTVTVNPSVLATSNGHSGSNFKLGSTSREKNVSGGSREKAMMSGGLMMTIALGMFWTLGLCIV